MPQVTDTILRRLDLPVMRRLEGLLQGDYKSAARGDGLDLADLREYQLYDDVRRMDWNATARQGTPYVREYLEDREIPVWLLLDMSPSMRFQSVSVSKHAVLQEFTTLICRLMLGRGNRTGVMIFSGRVDRTIPARGGRQQLLQILSAVARHRPGEHATDLGLVLKEAMGAIRRRSLIFVVSDFISAPGWEKISDAVVDASRRCCGAADRSAGTAYSRSRVPHLSGRRKPANSSSWTRTIATSGTVSANWPMRAIAALRGIFDKSGVDVLELATEDDVTDALLHFADMRKQSLRRSA